MPDRKLSYDIDVHGLRTVRLRSLWVLDSSDEERMSATKIAKCLVEEHGISTSYQAVDASFKKRNGVVDKNKQGYKIMQKGRDELKKGASTPDTVIIVEPGKPFTAKTVSLASVFKRLSGTIRICDPYLDCSTLDVLFRHVPPGRTVRLLTQKVKDTPPGIIKRALADLKKEGFIVEVRVNKTGTLHDRYIMDKSNFWLSGNSLNNLGNKESFIVSLGSDIHQSMLSTFEGRWNKATPHS